MKKNTVLELTFGWLGAPFMFGSIALSMWTYLWVIYIAFKESGFIAALITFSFPILSQLFWTYKLYMREGIDSFFVTISFIWLGCVVISAIAWHFSSKYANK